MIKRDIEMKRYSIFDKENNKCLSLKDCLMMLLAEPKEAQHKGKMPLSCPPPGQASLAYLFGDRLSR